MNRRLSRRSDAACQNGIIENKNAFPREPIMSATLLQSAASGLRIALFAALMLGPLTALGFAKAEGPVIGKAGAGFVLFVSLQRQSMS